MEREGVEKKRKQGDQITKKSENQRIEAIRNRKPPGKVREETKQKQGNRRQRTYGKGEREERRNC